MKLFLNRITLFLVVFSIISGCEHPESKLYKRYDSTEVTSFSNSEKYKVVGVKDGDTFVILMNGKEQTVRFSHIDCPEKKQPFGKRAKQFVSDACFGEYVTLKNNDKTDRYGRILAEVILSNGQNLNKELVKNGLAWHFKKYSNDGEYAQLEIDARKNKIGIWSEPHPVEPWEWRKGKR